MTVLGVKFLPGQRVKLSQHGKDAGFLKKRRNADGDVFATVVNKRPVHGKQVQVCVDGNNGLTSLACSWWEGL